MQFLNWFRKKRALKQYIATLPLVLSKLHGRKNRYTRNQIETAIAEERLTNEYKCYAFAMFMSRDEYAKVTDSDLEYDPLRSELAGKYFSDDTTFTIDDLIQKAETLYFGVSVDSVGSYAGPKDDAGAWADDGYGDAGE